MSLKHTVKADIVTVHYDQVHYNEYLIKTTKYKLHVIGLN
jgi:hypothetical protein